MAFNDFMNKVRHWDNMTARWMMRHFYFMFFQIVLVVIFVFWFGNNLKVIDLYFHATEEHSLNHLMAVQAMNTSIIVLLMLLNSFWLLYIFNMMNRLRNILKEVSFHLSKLRSRPR